VRLAIGKAADCSILAVHWAATFYSHLFENEHPPSQPFRNPLEVNFAILLVEEHLNRVVPLVLLLRSTVTATGKAPNLFGDTKPVAFHPMQ
jgi:hypothetical protein